MTDVDALEDIAALIEHKMPYQAGRLRDIAAKLRAVEGAHKALTDHWYSPAGDEYPCMLPQCDGKVKHQHCVCDSHARAHNDILYAREA